MREVQKQCSSKTVGVLTGMVGEYRKHKERLSGNDKLYTYTQLGTKISRDLNKNSPLQKKKPYCIFHIIQDQEKSQRPGKRGQTTPRRCSGPPKESQRPHRRDQGEFIALFQLYWQFTSIKWGPWRQASAFPRGERNTYFQEGNGKMK